jgi:adenosylhomocysteinase
MSMIRNAELAPAGKQKIEWVRAHMPLLSILEEEFVENTPFAGVRIAVSVHLEAKTARLCQLLAAGGAEVHATGSNPLSTKDDVCAALAESGVNVYAWYGATQEEYEAHLKAALACRPHIIIDDGGDLLSLLHGELSDCAENVIGGCEETTTGVLRMTARAKAGKLRFPMIAVNDADTKHLFDNRFGTGQSVWDGITRTTNLLIAGKTVVVAGFGHCGRGVAEKAQAFGARVIVTEVDPVKALEAAMLGYTVMPMDEAAKEGDIFITVTGCKDVIGKRHFPAMKDGAILCNAGHFDVEVDVAGLRACAKSCVTLRENIEGFTLQNGRTICLLAQGRLVNLASGDGHPAEIMDMSFALQALSALYLAKEGKNLAPDVYKVPKETDERVARLALASMGMGIDSLTQEQFEYLHGV